MEDSLECPLCLDVMVGAVFANCGHSFCARCILDIWEHQTRECKSFGGDSTSSTRKPPVLCPIDRRTITMLIPAYSLRSAAAALRTDSKSDAEINEAVDPELDKLIAAYTDAHGQISRPDRKALASGSGPAGAAASGLYEAALDDVAILSYAQRTDQTYRYLVLATVLFLGSYFIYPFDILPEASLGMVGYLDDAGVVLLGCWLLHSIAKHFVERARRRSRGSRDPRRQ